MLELVQDPAPGERRVCFVGDSLQVVLRRRDGASWPEGWRAALRTNLGRAAALREEIIAAVESGRPPTLGAWHDIPLALVEGEWVAKVALTEVGFFRAKAYATDAGGWQHWPVGPDLGVNVQPAGYRSGNTIYCAWPRLFGHAGAAASSGPTPSEGQLSAWDAQGYTVIPPSGKLRDLVRQLPHIMGRLGCRILHLLPVNPAPTTYARFGRFGSPYAAQDLLAVDPALVEFDRRTTGVDQFRELTFAVHRRGGRVFLDMVINHTGWGARLQETHPEWFLRSPGGEFVSPGAWGTTWEDLVELEHGHAALRQHLAEVFLEWCRRGVDGFRCDAGYKVPVAVWQFITARVRQEFPDTVFLLEGLGGAWEATELLLTEGGLQWAYSELFQNYDGQQVSGYLDHALRQSERVGLLVHYSETHDNPRLAARGRAWSLLRNRLCALTSVSGGFGFTCGVEWLDRDKIQVHTSRGLAWDTPEHLVAELAQLNRLLAEHPCFFDGAALTRLSPAGGPVYALLRRSAEGKDVVLVVANTAVDRPNALELEADRLAAVGFEASPDGHRSMWVDLLSSSSPVLQRAEGGSAGSGAGETAAAAKSPSAIGARSERRLRGQVFASGAGVVQKLAGDKLRLTLAPGAVVCLSPGGDVRGLGGEAYRRRHAHEALAVTALSHYLPIDRVSAFGRLALGEWVERDVAGFLAGAAQLDPETPVELLTSALQAGAGRYPRVVRWGWRDRRRVTLVPAEHWLVLEDDVPFRATIEHDGTVLPRHIESCAVGAGFVAAFAPASFTGDAMLKLERYGEGETNVVAALRFLGDAPAPMAGRLDPEDLSLVLLTNGRGGMARLRVNLGSVRSKYDCLLAANLHAGAPVDRHVFAKRARVWVNADGFLSPLDAGNLAGFDPGPPARWRFVAHAGDGRTVEIGLEVGMVWDRNATVLRFTRGPLGHMALTAAASARPSVDAAAWPAKAVSGEAGAWDVRLTVRVDLEDRSFHWETERNGGAEAHFGRHCHPIARESASGQGAVPADSRPSGVSGADLDRVGAASRGRTGWLQSATGYTGFAFTPAPGRQLEVWADTGQYHPQAEWCERVPHPVEASRGQVGQGDAYSPGWFELPLAEGARATLIVSAEPGMAWAQAGQRLEGKEASVGAGPGGAEPGGEATAATPAEVAEAGPAWSAFAERLATALRAFVVRRDDGRTVIAGYPWFLDWGRDTLICARGLLAAGWREEVRQILRVFGRFERDGTLPNTIHGEDASNRDTTDAPLWYGLVCEEFQHAVGVGEAAGAGAGSSLSAPEVYRERVSPGGRTIAEVLRSIAAGYLRGTPNGIRVDPATGLVWSPSHFTWMDTNYPAGTPREGYPVEIQVLWIRLLRQLDGLGLPAVDEPWAALAQRAQAAFDRLFWLDDRGYFADVLLARSGQPAEQGVPDQALRSNCLFGIALGLVTGARARRAVEAARRHLVVPGALRSLAPLPVTPPLPIRGHDGRLLNDPDFPYLGRYEGDEDTRRKPAYHNGTAWVWTLPTFCEALARAWDFEPASVEAARAYLSSMDGLLSEGCLGHLPEIVDGDAPHAQRGCDAQAWSVSEALRVLEVLSR
ncbi:MAG: amylo-alpha-1,6-glucosidase [Verrucomicrobia bacterium]|nr:amylo-alpha-1,6-glucosidase [Verrucomicrobiota bacterium]